MSDLILVAVIAGSAVFGAIVAEFKHRSDIKALRRGQGRNALIAEYFDGQHWQFLSIEEWLRANGYE